MGDASGLFEPSPLLDWLPDETLFSLVSRLHFFWGTGIPWKTSRILFGTTSSGCFHDFPDRLFHFAQKTQGQLGSAESLAIERTLLRYYRLFLSSHEYEKALTALLANGGSLFCRNLDALASHTRVKHPLKVCPDCMEQDWLQTGWAYWHGQHQYPGVWSCPLHGRPLIPVPIYPTFALPNQFALEVESGYLREGAALPELTTLIVGLVEHGPRIDQEHLSWLCRERMVQLGLLKPADVLDPPAIATDFMRHVQRFRELPELPWLPETFQSSGLQLEGLLQGATAAPHPLRYMLVISWLWGTAERFWQDYAQAPEIPVAGNIQIPVHWGGRSNSHAVPDRDAFLGLLNDAQWSVMSMAKTLGVDPATVMRWAVFLHIQLPYRALKLGDDQLTALKALLRGGAEMAVVTRQFGISRPAVMMMMKAEAGLREAWQQARFEKLRQQSRASWLAAGGGGDLKAARIACSASPAVFQWLYKHDYEWLLTTVMEAAPPPPVSEVLVDDENAEDTALYAKILIAALRLHLSADKSIEHMWWYYCLVPGLKSSMKQLNRFPRSKQLLAQLICQWRRRPKNAPDLFD